ncbi:MAG: RHS repeat-associated core domain-containing protein, partial [Acidobacteriaceae bacterium]
TGRFISEDPMGLAAGPNEYAYVGDDPIDFIDPFGTDKKKACEKQVLTQKFGSFMANYIIPDFSLLSLTDGIQQLWNGGGWGGLGGYAKGTGVSLGVKGGILAVGAGYGTILTVSGRNMAASYPALASTAGDLLESGAFWTTTASTAAEAAGGIGLVATAFATGADYWARQQCQNVQ